MVITLPISHPRSDGLRPADLSRDIPHIVDLLRLVFGDSLDADDRQWLGEANHSGFQDALYRFNPAIARLSNGFVWEADGRIIGNVTLLPTKIWGRYLVANVAVHPSYRRRGIARALMQAVSDSVQSRGGRVILLQVVKDNTNAIELYRSFGYRSVGNMTTWYATANQVHQIRPSTHAEFDQEIRLLPNNLWRAAYQLDTDRVPADLNWPEPLHPQAYRQTIFRRIGDFMNGRLFETWSTAESHRNLTGLVTIVGEWGRAYLISLRVHSQWSGTLERPLLAKIIRRLTYLPRRNVRIDHPEDDSVTDTLLREANFTPQRTLTHMRLDLSK